MDIEKQQKARLVKAELNKEKAFEKVSNKMLDDVMLFRLYESDACWKGNPTVVTKNLRNLTSDIAKRQVLKTNNSIFVKGFGCKGVQIH